MSVPLARRLKCISCYKSGTKGCALQPMLKEVFGHRCAYAAQAFHQLQVWKEVALGLLHGLDPMPSSIDSCKPTYFNERKINLFFLGGKMSAKSHLINSKSKMLEYTLTIIKSVVEIKVFLSS